MTHIEVGPRIIIRLDHLEILNTSLGRLESLCKYTRKDVEINLFSLTYKDRVIQIPTEVWNLSEAGSPGQVPGDPGPVTPKKKAAAAPSPAPKKKTDGRVNFSKTMKCPYCDLPKDTRVLHRHVSTAHKDQYDKEAMTRYIKGKPAAAAQGPAPTPAADLPGSPGPTSNSTPKDEIAIQGIDQDLLQAIPDVRPRTRGDPKILSPGLLPGPAVQFREGMHVKTIQLYEGISTGMIGSVRKRLGKNIEVNFGKSGYRTIPEGILVAV